MNVVSPGQEKRRLLPRELVPGCVIELHSMMTMPCDAVILSGDCLSFVSSGEQINFVYLELSPISVILYLYYRRNFQTFAQVPIA